MTNISDKAKTVNGVAVKTATVFFEGGYYRWQIVTTHGREYVDGGNYNTPEEAEAELLRAYDRP